MSNAAALQAKADGSAAWSVGNYPLAAEHFTTAINIGGDKEFLKVLHSNRSAAYLKLNKITEALRDGNKCVELDSGWAKGYVRKGDALLASKQFTEAYNAYNSGARIAPSDTTIKEKCEQAMRAMRNAAESTSNASRSSTTAGTGGPVEPYVQYAQLAILVLTVVYAVPLLSLNYRYLSYR
jgi:tetratricopeptide (TPR) repeat protein